MKKIIIAVCLISVLSFAQDKKYFDSPFGGGGGFSPGWFIPNVDPLNVKLKQIGAPELSTSGIFTTGGAGFIYIGVIKNLRVGGIGFGGSTSESGKVTTTGSSPATYDFETEYSIGGGGLTIEYSLPFIKNVGVSIGAIIGGGAIEIETFRNSGSFGWDNVWTTNSSASDDNISRTLQNSFFFITPTLNIDIPFYRFLSFRIGGGYQLALGEDWTIENDKSLSGVPSDLNGNGFFIQSGIFIGFFSF